AETGHPMADQPVRKVTEQAAYGDPQSKRAAPDRILDCVHDARLDDGIAGHEEKAVGHEHDEKPAVLSAEQVWEEYDDRGRDTENQARPALAPAVAQMAKQRIADDRREENAAQGDAGLLDRKPVSVLQKERPKAAHAAAREIPQTEGKRRGDEQHGSGGCAKKFFSSRLASRVGDGRRRRV